MRIGSPGGIEQVTLVAGFYPNPDTLEKPTSGPVQSSAESPHIFFNSLPYYQNLRDGREINLRVINREKLIPRVFAAIERHRLTAAG